ncbi:MAG: hypothetical protein Q9217_003313 [Psora testacea]
MYPVYTVTGHAMNDLRPVPHQDHHIPITHHHGIHDLAISESALDEMVTATPSHTPLISEIQYPEEALACGTPACSLLPLKDKLEQLLAEREAAEAESTIKNGARKQPAAGKWKTLSANQPTHPIHKMAPLHQISSLSGTGGKEAKREVDVISDYETAQTTLTNIPEDKHRRTATAHQNGTQSRSPPLSVAPLAPKPAKPSISQMLSTLQKFPTATARFCSPSASNERSERQPRFHASQISMPAMPSTTTNPISRSRSRPWPGNYSPGRASPCTPTARETAAQMNAKSHDGSIQRCNRIDGERKEDEGEEDISHWSSDSEEDEKEGSLRLSWRPPGKPKKFKGRLSDWLCRS